MGTERQESPNEELSPEEWDDDETTPLLRMVGRLIKKWRDRAGLTQLQLGEAIGYSLEHVSSVEQGRRSPRYQFLAGADRVLGADGMILEMQGDVEKVRYPKKVSDLTRWERESVEIRSYNDNVVHGLLQTEEYAWAQFGTRLPPFTPDEKKQRVAVRMARQKIIDPEKVSPLLTFIQEEASLLRPVGGKEVLRRQLEHLLEVGQLPTVSIQVLPMNRADHAGLSGGFKLLRLRNGKMLGYNEIQRTNRLISDPEEIHALELKYGRLQSQALASPESMEFIEKLLGAK
jgi:transcriptional regulator with XRE-family HTH domain